MQRGQTVVGVFVQLGGGGGVVLRRDGIEKIHSDDDS